MNTWKIPNPTRKGFSSLLNSNFTFIELLVSIFLCIGFVNILNHEMWRDELEAWFVTKNSSSLYNLFHNLRYEGHAGLWHICLYLSSRIIDQPVIMQFIHLIIATGVIYIFTRYSPFTKIQKILFAFGYFPLYEYATISRNYALGILLIFAFCAVFRSRNKNYLVLSCILFLLAQISVFGLIIAISLGSTLFFECVIDKNLRKSVSVRKMQIVVSIFIFIFGVITSIFQLIPPPDSGLIGDWRTNIDARHIARTITAIWKSYIPIPNIDYHFWNTNIITSTSLQAILSLTLLCFSLLLFVRKPVVLFLYSLGTMGLFAFFYSQFLGLLRHHGHLFIMLFVCLWISDYYPNVEMKSLLFNYLTNFCKKHKSRFILVILSVHFIACIIASGIDWLHPFSASKATAKFIVDKKMNNMLMLDDADYAASALTGYLNREIYYPCGDRFGSFIIWDVKRKELNTQEVLNKAEKLIAKKKSELTAYYEL